MCIVKRNNLAQHAFETGLSVRFDWIKILQGWVTSTVSSLYDERKYETTGATEGKFASITGDQFFKPLLI